MDEKKVIEAICKLNVGINAKREKIKHNKVFCPKQDNSQLEEDIDIYETAIEALEKQIAKKPVIYKGTNRADCPICGMTVRGIAKPFGGFCSKCGQRLDWGDSNA